MSAEYNDISNASPSSMSENTFSLSREDEYGK